MFPISSLPPSLNPLYLEDDIDKENAITVVSERVKSAVTRVKWAPEESLCQVTWMDSRSDLSQEEIEKTWYELRSLGFGAMIQRANPEEMREYVDSFQLLQDDSEDGIKCPLWNPEQYTAESLELEQIYSQIHSTPKPFTPIENDSELLDLLNGDEERSPAPLKYNQSFFDLGALIENQENRFCPDTGKRKRGEDVPICRLPSLLGKHNR